MRAKTLVSFYFFNSFGSRILTNLFFYNLYFQVVEFDGIYEVVASESCFVMSLEFFDVVVEPDWLAQVEFVANLIECMKYFMCSGVICLITDHSVLQEMIVFPNFSP